jgi:NodT family efflux transporter outer membrane factor (OMF) lipoprotein
VRAARPLALGVLMLLTGCVAGPNYRQPKASIEARWASPLGGGESAQPAQLAGWWRGFDDSHLSSLMTQAVESNLTLRIAESRIREARAERDVVAGRTGPEIGTAVSYSRNRYGANGFPPLPPGTPLDYNQYTAGFDAAWEIDLFGGTRRAVEAANDEIGAVEYRRRDVLVSLLAQVARDYIQARGYQGRLAIARHNIEVEQDTLDLTRSRFQHGLSSDLDVQQAEALLNTTQAEVPSLQAGFIQAVYQLSVLLDRSPGALLGQMSTPEPIPLTPPMVPVGLPSDLLQRRPDIQRAERELAAATARVGEAQADLFPKFSLTGVIGLTSLSAATWPEYASRYWSAGPALQWEIFEAGRIRANVRVQDARQTQALDGYQQTVLVALGEVESDLIAYAREQTRRESLRRSEQADDRALELSTQLYRNGLVDFLDVLDSERSLYGAQEALIQSEQAVSLDLVQLYKSLGGGWE